MLSPMTESHFLKAYLISEVHLKKCLIMKPSPVHPNQNCNFFFPWTPKNLTDTLLMPFILFYQVQVLGWTDVFIGRVGRRGIKGSQDTYMFKRKCSTFCKWLYHLHSHWPCMSDSVSLICLPINIYCHCIFLFRHSDMFVVISHCGIGLHFPGG